MPSRADADPELLDADLDDIDDLDVGGHDQVDERPGPGERSERLPRWARSPWALPAATTAVLLVVGVAGLQQVRATSAADVAQAVQLASVQLGGAEVVYTGDPERAEHDGEGRLLQEVRVPVRNSGEQDVELLPVSMSVDHTTMAGAQESTSLRAGTGGTLSVELAVDCDEVPAWSGSSSSTPPDTSDVLRLAVTAGGRSADHEYLLPDAGWGALSDQLTWVCSPDAQGQGLGVESTEVDGDRLVVQLRNGSDEPVEVQLQAPAVLRATAEPSLPAEVPATGALTVSLGLDPDCSRLSGRADDPYSLQLDLLTRVDGTTQTYLDATATAAWVARQVALRCG